MELNLQRYNGNFVELADREFVFTADAQEHFGTGVDNLELDLSCPVAIFPHPNGETIVQIETNKPDEFKVYQTCCQIKVSRSKAEKASPLPLSVSSL